MVIRWGHQGIRPRTARPLMKSFSTTPRGPRHWILVKRFSPTRSFIPPRIYDSRVCRRFVAEAKRQIAHHNAHDMAAPAHTLTTGVPSRTNDRDVDAVRLTPLTTV